MKTKELICSAVFAALVFRLLPPEASLRSPREVVVKHEIFTIGQYLDEAKHTYVQALSRYQARDLEGAREFAGASSSLSRVVEILISRVCHSNSNYPRLVPLPPDHVPARGNTGVAQHDLERVGRLLARIRWVTENGTLPSEDSTSSKAFIVERKSPPIGSPFA